MLDMLFKLLISMGFAIQCNFLNTQKAPQNIQKVYFGKIS